MASPPPASPSFSNTDPTAARVGSAGGMNYSDFSQFFERWIVEQEANLHHLMEASSNEGQEPQERMLPLVARVVDHYEEYYRVKAASAHQDVLSMFSPNWISDIESFFQWLGGWQPSAAFHLVYSKQGIQLLNRLEDILGGVRIGDLADISPIQLRQLDELQRWVIAREREISEMAATAQSRVADSTMVELSHIITEMKRQEGHRTQSPQELPAESEMAEDMEKKKKDMLEVLEEADRLRMNTIRGIVDILSPMQAVHFLISAAEVHLRVHEWGMKHDQARSAQR